MANHRPFIFVMFALLVVLLVFLGLTFASLAGLRLRKATASGKKVRVVLQVPHRAIYTYAHAKALTIDEAIRKQQALVTALSSPKVLGAAARDPQQVQVEVGLHATTITVAPSTMAEATTRLSGITAAMKTLFGAKGIIPPAAADVFHEVDGGMLDAVSTIEVKRLNADGIMAVTAQQVPPNQVVLAFSTDADTAHLRELLSTTGRLEFRLFTTDMAVSNDDTTGGVVVSRGTSTLTDAEVVTSSFLVATGREMKPACKVTTDFNDMPAVSFSLVPAARAHFARVTQDNVGRNLAIVFDGHLITAPMIRDRIAGDGIISGGFKNASGEANMVRAQQLANLLNAGTMPAPVTIVEIK